MKPNAPTSPPPARLCNSCRMMHPPPWDDACPVKNARAEEVRPITEFGQWLVENLVKYKNSNDLILGIKKLIQVKGIPK